MKKKVTSTYEEFIEDPTQKELLDKEYSDLLVSELLLALMDEDNISVRKLALKAGVSPTIIQALRSGKKTNVAMGTFAKILDAVGYEIVLLPKNQPITRLRFM